MEQRGGANGRTDFGMHAVGRIMAKFFFDLHECGEVIVDQDGSEIDDLEAARTQAIIAARDIMCGEISRGELCLSCHIEIRDEAHAVVDRVAFRDAVAITGL